MKTSLITFTLLLSSLTAIHATSIIEKSFSLIENKVLSLSLENEDQKSLIVSTKFCPTDECIVMEFQNNLIMIQLYNEKGEIEMMFPVASKKVNLGISLFESGKYKLGFTIEGECNVQFANISIN